MDLQRLTDDTIKNDDSIFDEPWKLPKLRKELKIDIKSHDNIAMEFDLIGIYPALVEIVKNLLCFEVPSMAIDQVTIVSNTTSDCDNTWEDRFERIPLKPSAKMFQFRKPGDDVGTDKDTLRYEFKFKCVDERRREDIYLDDKLLSKDLKWVPFGDQKSLYNAKEMGALYRNYVIAKKIPLGEEIHMTCTAIKGIGNENDKFSPVSTAICRQHPYINLLDDIYDDQADRLTKCFSIGTIDVVTENGRRKAVIKDERHNQQYNRERLKEFMGKVQFGRIKDHSIFIMESYNNCPPDELFRDAIEILKKKCSDAIITLKELSNKSLSG